MKSKSKSLSGAMGILNTLKPIDEYSNNVSDELKNMLVKVAPAKIINWKYHDRPDSELGDITSLATALKNEGQQQPCLVRPFEDNSNYEYELIIGQRRWMAAIEAQIDLLCIVKEMDDYESAIAQAAENNNRKDLSDYAKAMSYHQLIKKGIIKQNDLTQKLNINKMQVSRLMSFTKIPKEIVEAIVDMANISARTSSQIVQLASKGEKYINAIIQLSEQLKEGKIGSKRLVQLVEKEIEKKNKKTTASERSKKILSQMKNIKIIEVEKENEKRIEISLPESISNLIKDKQDFNKKLMIDIKRSIEKFIL